MSCEALMWFYNKAGPKRKHPGLMLRHRKQILVEKGREQGRTTSISIWNPRKLMKGITS